MKKTDEKKSLLIRRVACLAVIAVLIGVAVFIYIRYGRQLWTIFKDVDQFKDWIDGFGMWSAIVFVALRTIQTVAKVIPAEPLEIGSGLAFGAVGGMLLCLLGSMIGTVIILFISRKFGTRVLKLFRLDSKLQSMKFLQDKQKRNVLLFIYYVLPGTPKDGMAYFVGLTDMNLVEYMIISSIGRIPSIITSSICGAQLGEKNLPLAIGIFVVTTVLGLVGGLLYKKIAARYEARHAAEENETQDANIGA